MENIGKLLIQDSEGNWVPFGQGEFTPTVDEPEQPNEEVFKFNSAKEITFTTSLNKISWKQFLRIDSNNYRKMHGLPMRRGIKICKQKKIIRDFSSKWSSYR